MQTSPPTQDTRDATEQRLGGLSDDVQRRRKKLYLHIPRKTDSTAPLLGSPSSAKPNSEQDSSRSSFEVVERRLLKPIDNTLPHSKSLASISVKPENSPVISNFANKPTSAFKRLASTDTFKDFSAGPSSPIVSKMRSTLKSLTPRSSSLSHRQIVVDFDKNVYEDQPSQYWSGRFVSLRDRYDRIHGTDMLESALPRSNSVPEPRAYDLAQASWIFEQLYACCRTNSAKKSLTEFKRKYAQIVALPELLTSTEPEERCEKPSRRSMILGSGKSRTDSGHDKAPQLPALTIPRKPLPFGEEVTSPRSIRTVNTCETDLSGKSQDSFLKSSGRDRAEALERDRSFFGKLIDIGRKASWTSTTET
ncbi:MAG: hypothetical protein Q9162_006748 [Coniocarpon cinnabarinum]